MNIASVLHSYIYLCIFLRMNKLYHLPRGFGSFPKLEILDLSYNNLTEQSLPANFFFMSENTLIVMPLNIDCPVSLW